MSIWMRLNVNKFLICSIGSNEVHECVYIVYCSLLEILFHRQHKHVFSILCYVVYRPFYTCVHLFPLYVVFRCLHGFSDVWVNMYAAADWTRCLRIGIGWTVGAYVNVYNISIRLCVVYTSTISLRSHQNRTIRLCEFHAYVQDINSEFLFLFSAVAAAAVACSFFVPVFQSKLNNTENQFVCAKRFRYVPSHTRITQAAEPISQRSEDWINQKRKKVCFRIKFHWIKSIEHELKWSLTDYTELCIRHIFFLLLWNRK